MTRTGLVAGIVSVSVVFLSACGSPGTPNAITAHHVGTAVSGAYAAAVRWHGNWYMIGGSISTVGNEIGTTLRLVKSYPHGNTTVSNFAPVGTKLFSIPGAKTQHEIAVEYPKGRYEKAVN